MSIYERYELLEIVNDGPVKTFRARQIQTGQIVAVHLLIAPRVIRKEFLKKCVLLTDPARKELLEFGDHEGTAHMWSRMSGNGWLIFRLVECGCRSAHSATGAAAPTTDRFAKAGNWRIPVSEFGRKMEPVAGTPAPPEPQTSADSVGSASAGAGASCARSR